MQKYKKVGKHKVIANNTNKNVIFLKCGGALLYKSTKVNPVILIVNVNVSIGLKSM
ncbi:MAG: hypothetical protein ACFFFT_09525 [Candidatus Thorarchaeota archaeon]